MLFRSLITYVYNFFVKIWTAKVGNYWFTTKNPGCFPGFNVFVLPPGLSIPSHWRGGRANARPGWVYTLLNFNFSASFFQLSNQSISVSFANTFFHWFWSAVNEVLSFFQS